MAKSEKTPLDYAREEHPIGVIVELLLLPGIRDMPVRTAGELAEALRAALAVRPRP